MIFCNEEIKKSELDVMCHSYKALETKLRMNFSNLWVASIVFNDNSQYLLFSLLFWFWGIEPITLYLARAATLLSGSSESEQA